MPEKQVFEVWKNVDLAEQAARVCKESECGLPVRVNTRGMSLGRCEEHQREVSRGARRGPTTTRVVGADGLPGYRQSSGYVNLYGPEGIIAEHKYVMQKKLGRGLRPGESVHHLNGLRDDNAPDNLELWVVRQPPGQRVSDLIQFVARQYADEVLNAIRTIRQEESA